MSKRSRLEREKRSGNDGSTEQQDECIFYDKVIVSQEDLDADLMQRKIPEKPHEEELVKLFGDLHSPGLNLVFFYHIPN